MGSSFLLYYLGFGTYKTAIDKKTSVILDE